MLSSRFEEKYISQKDFDALAKPDENKKTILSNDAFAIGEMISELIVSLEQVRQGMRLL